MMVLIVVLLKSLWKFILNGTVYGWRHPSLYKWFNACGEYRDVGLCSVLCKEELGLKNLSEAAIGPVECNACGEHEDNGVRKAL